MTSVGRNRPDATRFFRMHVTGSAFVAALLCAWAGQAHAVDCPAYLAQIVLVKGSVEVVRQGTGRLPVADTQTGLCAGGEMVTVVP